MQPNFNSDEAKEMLALSYAADLLGPTSVPGEKGFHTIEPAKDKSNPLPDDNGSTYPYPTAPIWPANWEPGVPVLDPILYPNPWHNSIVQAAPDNVPPIIANLKFGSNNIIITKNTQTGAYAIAFAGTENLTGVLQDIAFIPVSAGPLNFTFYKSDTTYIVNPDYYNQPANTSPPVIHPTMHFGFRYAVEEYTVKAKAGTRHNLLEVFQRIGENEKEIDLYITGHSLGAAMAGVFSAWVQANGLPGIDKVNLKTYTFASPKWANDALANNYDNGVTSNGYSFRVVNNLDTVPQIPFTWQGLNDLNNPNMIKALIPVKSEDGGFKLPAFVSNAIDKAKELLSKLPNENFNYVDVGTSYPVMGEFPVALPKDETNYPAWCFPNGNTNDKTLASLQQEWWQHWPWVYYRALEAKITETEGNGAQAAAS